MDVSLPRNFAGYAGHYAETASIDLSLFVMAAAPDTGTVAL
jgi:hypothetical protein